MHDVLTKIPRMRLLLDCSLSLINRTGAHYIAQDLAAEFGDQAVVRRWRLLKQELPNDIARRICGRLMLRELAILGTSEKFLWPEPKGAPLKRLFLDPLYVTRSRLESSDIVLCHDIGPVSHPQLYGSGAEDSYQKAYAKIAAARPGIVFVSQASQRAFEARFGLGFLSTRLRSFLFRAERGCRQVSRSAMWPGAVHASAKSRLQPNCHRRTESPHVRSRFAVHGRSPANRTPGGLSKISCLLFGTSFRPFFRNDQ